MKISTLIQLVLSWNTSSYSNMIESEITFETAGIPTEHVAGIPTGLRVKM